MYEDQSLNRKVYQYVIHLISRERLFPHPIEIFFCWGLRKFLYYIDVIESYNLKLEWAFYTSKFLALKNPSSISYKWYIIFYKKYLPKSLSTACLHYLRQYYAPCYHLNLRIFVAAVLLIFQLPLNLNFCHLEMLSCHLDPVFRRLLV